MKNTAHSHTSKTMDLFTSSQLNQYEMFAVRGGEEKKSDPDDDGGSTAPQQEDGFN